MNYYPFHLGDYASHTGHLDPMEDLAYRRMLDAYYLREGPLPKDVTELARLIRLRDHAATIRDVLNEFFQETPEGWRHVRCDDEILKMQDKQAKARASAYASVSARKAKALQPLSDGNPNAQRTFNERSTDVQLPTPTPTPTPTPKKESAIAPPPDVDEQVWKDWLTLRKAKKAPVTETVVTNARKEAEKAGVTFQHFLMIWCARGSQGLQADWLKPAERGQSNAVSFAQQAADIARTTVPSRIDRDPSLVQLEEDFKKAVPMPDSVRKALGALTRRVSTNEIHTDGLKGA